MKKLVVLKLSTLILLLTGCLSVLFESDPDAEVWNTASEIILTGAFRATPYLMFRDKNTGVPTFAYWTQPRGWVFKNTDSRFQDAELVAASASYFVFTKDEAEEKIISYYDFYSGWVPLAVPSTMKDLLLIAADVSIRDLNLLAIDAASGLPAAFVFNGSTQSWEEKLYDVVAPGSQILGFASTDTWPILLSRDPETGIIQATWATEAGRWAREFCSPLENGNDLLAFLSSEGGPLVIYREKESGRLMMATNRGEGTWLLIECLNSDDDLFFLGAITGGKTPVILCREREANRFVLKSYSTQTARWTAAKTLSMPEGCRYLAFTASAGFPLVFFHKTDENKIIVASYDDNERWIQTELTEAAFAPE